jgi:hypothetical protein
VPLVVPLDDVPPPHVQLHAVLVPACQLQAALVTEWGVRTDPCLVRESFRVFRLLVSTPSLVQDTAKRSLVWDSLIDLYLKG